MMRSLSDGVIKAKNAVNLTVLHYSEGHEQLYRQEVKKRHLHMRLLSHESFNH